MPISSAPTWPGWPARGWTPLHIVLPLGISFFVFQKVSYLIDVKRGDRHEYGLLDFCLFVSFFPQLIAGPLVRHNEIIHQFRADPRGPAMWENLSRGLVLFLIGMGKKLWIADTLAPGVDALFAGAGGGVPNAAAAWAAAGGYALQIYFDFSGYSDMAIGLARMFGLRLPMNFDAPYRAASIRDFWRRWHMTLSRFLRDYLYIPLGGNRHGPARQVLQRGAHHAAGRPVARRQLDVRGLGRAARGWRWRSTGCGTAPGWRLPGPVGWALTLAVRRWSPGCCSARRTGPRRGICWPGCWAPAGSGAVSFPGRLDDLRSAPPSRCSARPARRWRSGAGCARRPGSRCRPGWRRWRCCCFPADGCRMPSSTSSSDPAPPAGGGASCARCWQPPRWPAARCGCSSWG